VRIIVYDLPSEHRADISSNENKMAVKRVRIRAIRLLHSLGVQCTESVIVIPDRNLDKIDEAIEKVNTIYDELARRLDLYRFKPLIRSLPLTAEQVPTFTELAKRRLAERINESLDRINDVLDSINEIVQEEKRNIVRRNVLRLRREWSTIFELARELGIDLGRDYEYLISLIDKALDELREG